MEKRFKEAVRHKQKTVDLLQVKFSNRVMIRSGDHNWPPRSWELTPCDFKNPEWIQNIQMGYDYFPKYSFYETKNSILLYLTFYLQINRTMIHGIS